MVVSFWSLVFGEDVSGMCEISESSFMYIFLRERQQLAKRLRQGGIGYKKVRGIKNEGSAWIGETDALARFSWDVYQDKPYTQNLYSGMQQRRFLIQL